MVPTCFEYINSGNLHADCNVDNSVKFELYYRQADEFKTCEVVAVDLLEAVQKSAIPSGQLWDAAFLCDEDGIWIDVSRNLLNLVNHNWR